MGKFTFFTLFLFFSGGIIFPQSDTLITLSEIMFYPSASNSEFIEVYNLSDDDTIDISGWKIKYSTSNPDEITSPYGFSGIAPGQFAVIFEGDYDLQGGIYQNLIPNSALILTIDNNAFGSSGMSNSNDRTVCLLNEADDTLECHTYSADNASGFSEEKIILTRINDPSNWINSNSLNGTPGSYNSVSPKNHNLELSNLFVSPLMPFVGDTLFISMIIRNIGLQNADEFTAKIHDDINYDSLAQAGELIYSEEQTNLFVGDSAFIEFNLVAEDTGKKLFIGSVDYTADEDTADNMALKEITVHANPQVSGDVVINEFMYDPSPGEPEWIEIYNTTDSDIDLCGWKVNDRTRGAVISDSLLVITAGGYMILSEEETIHSIYNIPSPVRVINLPSLNNGGDEIILRDPLGGTIDSVDYKPGWGGKRGKSLERIISVSSGNDPTNWKTPLGIFSGTPGFINSVTPKSFDLSLENFKPTTPYAAIGNTARLEVEIKNLGSLFADNYSVEVYQDFDMDSTAQQEELIGTIEDTNLFPGESKIFFYTASDFTVGENRFFAIINFIEDEFRYNDSSSLSFEGIIINEQPGDLVINEIMYAPRSPEPEWIEIYNRSNKIISMLNYRIADQNDTAVVITSSEIINPSEFLVVARDSIIFEIYDIPAAVIVSIFPSLNNTGDEILLVDSLGRVIDSVSYLSSWGGGSGVSLERIDPFAGSNLSGNWTSSSADEGATPGNINSVTEKDHDLELTEIIFIPQFPFLHDTVSISALIKNIGKLNEEFRLLLCEDVDFDSTADHFIESSSALNLSSKDSTEVIFNFQIEDLISERAFEVKCICQTDQDTSNNIHYSIIKPGFTPSSIVINEIMYRPFNGEPEWVEIFNRSEHDINLSNWIITDVLTNPFSVTITNEELTMGPNEYLVISKDSAIYNFHRSIDSRVEIVSFANLNNDEDGIVIKDSRGAAIDSVLYSSDWGGSNGFSLERISADVSSTVSTNWLSSVDLEQSTPGRINSISEKKNDLAIEKISIFPLYPVPGDSINIIAFVKNLGSSAAHEFNIKFNILKEGYSLSLGEVPCGMLASLDSINIFSPEKFFLESETLISVQIIFPGDEDTLNNRIEFTALPGFNPGTLIINEIMYNPLPGSSEWIELLNISGSSINLKNWQISDLLGSPSKKTIIDSDLYLNTGNYLLIVRDTSSFFFDNVNCGVIQVDFSALGNSTDGIVIHDFRDAAIDSLIYSSDWGGEKGFSLERWDPDKLTTDSSNWSTSLNKSGGTPGAENSLASALQYDRYDLVINEILYDPLEGNSEFIEFFNRSKRMVDIGGWTMGNKDGKKIRVSNSFLTVSPDQFVVIASDSNIFVYFPWLLGNAAVIVTEKTPLSLPNSGESVILTDLFGNLIDSVKYFPEWHNPNIPSTKNKSLERINPHIYSNNFENWSTSADPFGSTPCQPNSILTAGTERGTKISIDPNPFSPDNDGHEDFTVISYTLTQNTSQIKIRVFDCEGRLVRTIMDNEPSGSRSSLVFDGRDDSGRALRIGIYILLLEAFDSRSGVIETLKVPCVIARIL